MVVVFRFFFEFVPPSFKTKYIQNQLENMQEIFFRGFRRNFFWNPKKISGLASASFFSPEKFESRAQGKKNYSNGP